MEQSTMSLFIGAFIAIVVGVVLMGAVGDKVHENTNMPYDSTVNETWTLNSSGEASTFWPTDANFTLSKDDVVAGSIVIRNCNNTALTLDTDYAVDSADEDSVRIDILDTATTQAIPEDIECGDHTNQTEIMYDRWQDNYIRGSSAARTLVGLVPLFYAIGILGIGILMAYAGLRKAGVF